MGNQEELEGIQDYPGIPNITRGGGTDFGLGRQQKFLRGGILFFVQIF